MKKEFKVGDRVKVRGYSCLGRDLDGKCFTITGFEENGDATLAFVLSVKLSQLIPLKPKRKPRDIWLNEYNRGTPDSYYLEYGHYSSEDEAKKEQASDCVRQVLFREILNPKRGNK